jgi:hypothetical protein
VEGYLAYYAADFKTPNGEHRSEWEKTRKERIRKLASIEVEVLSPNVSVDGNRAPLPSSRATVQVAIACVPAKPCTCKSLVTIG